MTSDSKIAYWSATWSTVFLFGVYLVSLLELAASYPRFLWNIPLCLVLLVIGAVIGYRRDPCVAAGAVVCFLVLGLGLVVSVLVLDTSYDGIRYHATGIITIPSSYNFIYEAAPRGQLGSGYASWVALYPKLTWVLGANFFATSGFFEAAKTINALGLLISFGFAYPLFQSWGVSRSRAALFATLVALNPISVAQFFTTLQDGFLASLLIGLGCLLLILIRSPSWLSSVGASMLVILIVNTKTTGVVFAAIFLASAFGWCLIRRLALRQLFLPVSSAVTGLLVFGYAPFTRALVRTGNPFHGVVGPGAVAIIETQLVPELAARSRIVLLGASLFGRTERVPEKIEFKVPGMCSWKEIRESYASSRFGGFGPLFSLALVLSMAALGLRVSRDRALRLPVGWLGLTMLVATLIHPGAWWARYVPHFFLLPIIPLLLFAVATEVRPIERLLFKGTILALAANLAIFSYTLARDVVLSRQMSAQLLEICDRSKAGRLVIYDSECRNVKGPIFIRSRVDAGTRASSEGVLKVEEIADVVFSVE